MADDDAKPAKPRVIENLIADPKPYEKFNFKPSTSPVIVPKQFDIVDRRPASSTQDKSEGAGKSDKK